MTTDAAMAAVLYPTPEPEVQAAAPVAAPAAAAVAETPAAEPTTSHKPAEATGAPVAPAAEATENAAITPEKIAAAIPEAIAKQRAADDTRKLYSPQVEFSKAIPDSLFNGVEGVPEGVAATVVAEIREVAADVGFAAHEIPTIRDAIRNAPTTDEARIAQREQAVEAVNRVWGQYAKAMVDLAYKFIQADPRRAALIAPAGDNPAVVLRTIELARAARALGRI